MDDNGVLFKIAVDFSPNSRYQSRGAAHECLGRGYLVESSGESPSATEKTGFLVFIILHYILLRL